MNKLGALIAGIALTALMAGCAADTTNSNMANGNNSNQAVLTSNNSNANTANANANANTANSNGGMTRADYDKDKERLDKEARDKAKEAGRKIGTGLEDAWLWTKTRTLLAAENDLRDSTINVDVDNGVITLSGNVASDAQVKKADAVAKSVEGNKGVKNMLKITACNSNSSGSKDNKNMGKTKTK